MINKKRLQPGRDAIQRYLDEISETPLLSDAEEQELALRIQQGDRRAADKLVTANLRYVVTIAHQYANADFTADDLISEGNIGLLKAAQKYKVQEAGKKDQAHKRFVTFAAPYIREHIERFMEQGTRMTGQEHGKLYSTDESLPIGSKNNFTLLNVIENKDAVQADVTMEQASLSEEMLNAIDILDERERAVIIRLYGIGTTQMTMADAGRSLDLKRERVRQIRDKALRKLRKASTTDSLRDS